MGTRFRRILAGMILLATGASAQSVWYVDAFSSPGGTGVSWAEAFDSLDPALAAATSVDQIWVAEGVYRPRARTIPSDPRSATFVLDDEHLFGGFAGWETTLAQRVGKYRTTVLSGDLGQPTVTSDNAYHVITARRFVELDGFTIRDGNTLGSLVGNGAGIYGEVVSTPFGGQGPSLEISRCQFVRNLSTNRGGALYAQLSHVLLESCYFGGNESVRGGALCVNASSLDAYNCRFIGNRASARGGAIFFFSDYGNPPRNRFSNCVFAQNQADEGGAAYLLGALNTAGNATWVNCTFTQNTAIVQGGAILANDGPSTLADPVNQLYNCIVWANSAPLHPNVSGLAEPAYSIVQGWVGGPNVFDVDPLFVDAAAGDFRLQPGSPAIDSGSADYMLPDLADLDQDGIFGEVVPLDLVGNPRMVDDPSVSIGVPPYLDLGAYER